MATSAANWSPSRRRPRSAIENPKSVSICVHLWLSPLLPSASLAPLRPSRPLRDEIHKRSAQIAPPPAKIVNRTSYIVNFPPLPQRNDRNAGPRFAPPSLRRIATLRSHQPAPPGSDRPSNLTLPRQSGIDRRPRSLRPGAPAGPPFICSCRRQEALIPQ
jgi:hypothetical protein